LPVERLRLEDDQTLSHATTQLVATGGYGLGYVEGHMQGRVPRGTYVEKWLLRPVALGGVQIQWTPGEKPVKVIV